MKYVCYELDEDSELSMNWYERIGNAIDKKKIASTNPDFHEAYNNVIYWWLELTAGDIPVRELGFDCNGEVIVAGPLGKNMGLFTYYQSKVNGFYPLEQYQFAEQWELFKETKYNKSI
ncbi:hypothetical protein [Psychromonas sp. Urea-02u-13]|uniref:hypothetical protein n=1 Tax=Psychromonas sp. Urea-02u-13 TaxID=2058326 RepID=UPI000C320A3D|nr:hypothetical protein [Psychromonas sp. Urea-02u-13]PKG36986.1 hypothetical protein CXF74_21285 [Psychromonas sp. Urea-02u-13]